jgi:putative transcriptional regulator
MERLDAPEPAAPPPPRPPRYLERLGVPAPLLRQPVGRRRWVTPGIWFAPLALEEGGRRTYLVHAAPGTVLAEHTHAGRELTLVLKGAFRDGSARYARGDFALTDDSVTHRPTVTEEESCLCLISADAPMRLAGRPARMIQALMGRLY